MRRGFTRFVGIDLGGGKGKKTAVACLEWAGERPQVVSVSAGNPDKEPWYDGPLLEFVSQFDAAQTAIAIDAPLTITACVRCVEPACPGLDACADPAVRWFREVGEPLLEAARRPKEEIAQIGSHSRARLTPAIRHRRKPSITPYTQRATEVYLHHQCQIAPRETLGQGMGPLAARGVHLCRALKRLGYTQHHNLIEVYPKATVQQLFGARVARRYKRQVGTWETRAEVLEKLRDRVEFSVTSGMARESCLQNDHCFDAVVCAFTAYLWACEDWTLPEEHRDVYAQDGWIYAPGLPGTPIGS